MDKDLGIKVTRLRRRLSVESEESTSPPAPSTPTKKRGGRLAAKPQLELIDEDANESIPKRTPRKSIARDVVEPEEKVMTPARRSTRIRSNTSLLAEAVTPKVTDSPRAKRAARRNSLLGSDNETPVAAPIRQTRRTRKDSTTSVEIIENDNQTPVAKQTKKNTKNSTPSANEKADIPANDDNLVIYVVTVTDAATEKESNKNTKSNENDDESSPTIRKSPRLKIKTPSNKDENNKDDSSFQLLEEPTQSAEIVNNVTPEKDKLDVALAIPLSLDEGSVTSTADYNNVNSNIKENDASKSITLPVQTITNDKMQIDNNSTKEEEFESNSTQLHRSKLDIKEEKLISSERYEKSDVEKLLENDPRNMESVVMIDDSDSNSGKLVMDLPNEYEDQCVPVVHSNHLVNDAPKTFDEPEPMDIDESIPINVTLNDFEQFVESNTEVIKQTNELPKNDSFELKANSKVNSPKTYENKNKSRNSSRHSITPENTESENQANKSKIKEEAQDSKSMINIADNTLNESRNKKKSSTTVAQADTQNLEKSTNENKSTLVLSQLKDISANDTKNASKSPDDLNIELSKSVTVTDIAKKSKNNITNVLTSTPLQQKSTQKLGMQINTSMISPNAGNKSLDTKTNKKTSPIVESSDSDSSAEEDAVKNKSKMIDDEASEASEDYESGDSRDDDERQYEIENEIVEKGETLESEQDFSNDSDYEKDSFVVSSDAEDDEMLSGTGNDLSLSDTELTMSKKSKKKFDERKRKQQKKASREMFEARHNLNKSNNDKSDKVKSKNNAKQLESSESENEIEKPKKKNRMRIDSSHDASVLKSDADESIGHKKKKTKRLSESICEDTTNVNEKEITICNESVSNKNDPLSAAIKLEPKTPQKDFNISTVPIVDKIEEVEVGDMTVMNSNETSDPLQTTIAQDEESLSSDNMEIIQNYDSLLNNLNDHKKVKTFDMSLNIEKEKKPAVKSKEPIIDQLNLTQTKKDKKNKSVNKSLSEKEKSTNMNKNVSKFVQDEESSDCIDMELLFPEDSNDSEVNVNKINQDKNTVKPAEEFIPLKKAEGKMHIPEIKSPSTKLNNSKLNKSKSKKEKESLQADAEDSSEPTESLKFFVDVTGDLDLSNSKKKNKKKYFNEEQDIDPNQSNSNVGEKDVQNVTANDESPMEVSFKSDKKKKKKHKHLNTSANESIVFESEFNNETEKREAEISNKDEIDSKVTEPIQSLNTSVKSDKKKKENKNLDVSNRENVTQSAKKKSRKSLEKLNDVNNDINMGMEEIIPETSFNSEKKIQKKKRNTSITDTNKDNTQDLPQVTEQTSTDNTQVTEQIPKNLDILFKTEKKKKKHKNSDVSISDQSLRLGELFDNKTVEQIEDQPENTNNKDTSLKSEKKKKKKHENKDLVQDEQNVQSNEQETTDLVPEVVTSSKKKKKRKGKDTSTQADDSDDAPEEISFQFEKATVEEIKEQKTKKRKLEAEEPQVAVQESKSKKKRKLSDKVENPGDQGDKNVTQKSSKKRKRQDVEMELEEKKAKVSKEHSLDKIHIPRLPISVLDQLDDEPPVPKKKGKAIATSEFVVEDARSRKNKPSTYLEQSVYLNDTPKKNKKKQKVKRNPVLPFMPTAETSDQGFTSNFRINVVSETPFVASNTGNFKTDYLAKQRIKKMGSFERFKTQRSHKLCKF